MAVHVCLVDDFVSLFLHPVAAPIHGPALPDDICTSYPITDSVASSVICLSHFTTTWPALGSTVGTTLAQFLPNVSPRTMTEGASVASPPVALPPHPARSITAHAMTAPAAFPLRLLEPTPLTRLLRALIRHRASLGLCPIIVYVFVTIGHGGLERYRKNTVLFIRFYPTFSVSPMSTSLERALRVDQRRVRAMLEGVN